jgi:hypothetical protein
MAADECGEQILRIADEHEIERISGSRFVAVARATGKV